MFFRKGKALTVLEDASQNKPIGYTLVICSEGNAGFYECGCMATPLECGYSVLGWNHPGFMCSSVSPAR